MACQLLLPMHLSPMLLWYRRPRPPLEQPLDAVDARRAARAVMLAAAEPLTRPAASAAMPLGLAWLFLLLALLALMTALILLVLTLRG